MRKLICWGLGLALVVTGYRAVRNAQAEPESALGMHLHRLSAKVFGHELAEETECRARCAGGSCVRTGECPSDSPDACDGTDEEGEAPSPPTGVIELTAADSTAPPSIFVPDGAEPPLAVPAPEPTPWDGTQPAAPPPMLPCTDDDEPAPGTIPFADDQPWPKNSKVTPAGWFDEPCPTDPEPACREDENHSRQYPGCPFPGGPERNAEPKKADRWRHEKPPILPVPPEVEGKSLPTSEPDAATGPVWHESKKPSSAAFLRHSVLKLWQARDSESPARQPVDTLELRPGDLPREGTTTQPF
jgi:hypothetical protein